ncbi:phage structural protein [Stenotrophomonas bentonitica]|uniref:phage structural protein n=1 Tax=Stenotrophomonas bentonitica TaxID=1450134 RepID=UPI0002F2578C
MGVKTYDSSQVIITFGPHIITGYAEDTFISVEEMGDGISSVVGANGEKARSMSQNRSLQVTLTLLQTSKSNDVLSAAAEFDRASHGQGALPMAITDLTGRTLIADASSWVVKKPNSEFGATVGTREWTLETSNDAIYHVGGAR